MDNLSCLAKLLEKRNQIDEAISQLTNRPAQTGRLGEFVAKDIFNIDLHEDRSHPGSDGIFGSGDLKGKSVNIKWYTVRKGIISLSRDQPRPDYYLMMTGPKTYGNSEGRSYPLIISSVYLFDSKRLFQDLESRDLPIGNPTSVRLALWNEAEIYPTQTNNDLRLSAVQKNKLKMFEGNSNSSP